MVKLTWDEVWYLCIAQWKWHIQQLDLGIKTDIHFLRNKWMRQNGFTNIKNSCFFCEYNIQNGGDTCSDCPGILVSSRFRCWHNSYDYKLKPRKFYAMILKLNKRRKKWYYKLWRKIF